jgi:hypothetical protein
MVVRIAAAESTRARLSEADGRDRALAELEIALGRSGAT